MKMKAVKIITAAFLLAFAFCVTANALDNEKYIDDSGFEKLNEIYDSLDSEQQDLMSSIGIDGTDFGSINNVSPADIFSLIKDIITGRSRDIIKNIMILAGVIVMCSVVRIFIPDSKKTEELIAAACIMTSVIILCVPITDALKSAVASVDVCSTFIKSLIPVMTGLIIASGSPAGAVTFRTFAFAAAQFISSSVSGFAVPVLSASASLDIAGSLLPEYKLDSLSSLIKKILISIISGAAAIYVAFLSLKDILNDAADTLSVKGVKLLINSAVPVIGSPLSELYGSMSGTASLIKSTAGVFAIIAVCVITLPPLINLVFWILSLKILGSVCDVMLQSRISGLFNSLAGVLTLMNVIMLLNSAIFIISVTLILERGG